MRSLNTCKNYLSNLVRVSLFLCMNQLCVGLVIRWCLWCNQYSGLLKEMKRFLGQIKYLNRKPGVVVQILDKILWNLLRGWLKKEKKERDDFFEAIQKIREVGSIERTSRNEAVAFPSCSKILRRLPGCWQFMEFHYASLRRKRHICGCWCRLLAEENGGSQIEHTYGK